MAVVMPGMVVAQGAVERPATHTVKRGDTLWDLAQQYLGDPFQWPQIYQLNKDAIKDPHWIYPNQVFNIPGGTAGTSTTAGGAATGTQSTRPGGMTVFNPQVQRAAQASRTTILGAIPRTAVRKGDYEAAPFMWAQGGLNDGGSIVGTAEPIGMSMSVSNRPIGYREKVTVELPRGTDAVAGRRLLVYRLGPVIAGQGQVVIPTGIVQLRGDAEGRRAHATLTAKFEDVFSGHGVTALDTLAMPMNTFPTRVEFGLSTKISWVYASPALPYEGQYLIFSATAAQGLVPGDQLSIRIPRAAEPTVDDEIGVAQVTRVTPFGVSAVLLDVRDSGIAAGARAQVSAKMP
jgi:LysM repeat protein